MYMKETRILNLRNRENIAYIILSRLTRVGR